MRLDDAMRLRLVRIEFRAEGSPLTDDERTLLDLDAALDDAALAKRDRLEAQDGAASAARAARTENANAARLDAMSRRERYLRANPLLSDAEIARRIADDLRHERVASVPWRRVYRWLGHE